MSSADCFLMAAIAYYVLQAVIIHAQGPDSILKKAVGRDWKGKLSPVCYLAAIPLAFVNEWISYALYLFVTRGLSHGDKSRVLALFRPVRVYAAPLVRCVDTVSSQEFMPDHLPFVTRAVGYDL